MEHLLPKDVSLLYYDLYLVMFIVFGLMIAGLVIFTLKRLCKKEKVFYRPKGPSPNIEYELTSVRSNNTSRVGEYQVPHELIKDIHETESLNTSSSGVGEPRNYGF